MELTDVRVCVRVCANLLSCVALFACGGSDAMERPGGGGRPSGNQANGQSDQASSAAGGGSSGLAGDGSGSAPSSGGSFGNPDPVDATAPAMVDPIDEGLDENTCARADVTVDRIRPRVVFLVDASSSMSEDFGGPTRWDALRDSLLADDGVVPMLEQLVKFGLVTFAGPRFTACPSYRYAAPAPSNLMFVDAAFPGAPPDESSTPTGAAMDWTIDNAFIQQEMGPDAKWEPQYMIFATDGEPNGCALGSDEEPTRDFDSVIAAAHKAASRGIKIFVLSLAEASGEFADHLAQVAEIGETNEVYSPNNKADLVQRMLEIVGAAISCEVELKGQTVAEGMACTGTVWLNEEELECDGADGWELVDPSHIRLNGQACEDFRLTPTAVARAEFPCTALE